MAVAKQKSISKSEFLKTLSESTGVAKKDVALVLDGISDLVGKHVGKKGPGLIQIPGLVKIRVKAVPAQPAKKGVKNPFTGELQDRPAKPASRKVRVVALKALKDMVK
ncbi:MAG: DNA-binding protein [Planctomycetaceae bacterium]|jgi:nucleoid DNA-binding protein|nr:MAG: DNA-binding protein [Planctomycetaceae bacterium]